MKIYQQIFWRFYIAYRKETREISIAFLRKRHFEDGEKYEQNGFI